jgi:hypothetical protein
MKRTRSAELKAFIASLKKGHRFKYKMYKNRNEIYD